MENFTFALNATIPVFLVIALGYILQRVHFLNDAFNKTANEFVFRCALPVSLFRSIAGMDFYSEFDLGFCLFCFQVLDELRLQQFRLRGRKGHFLPEFADSLPLLYL